MTHLAQRAPPSPPTWCQSWGSPEFGGWGRWREKEGGTNFCKLQDANFPFSLQRRVPRWNVSRQHCKVPAARGMPARLPRAVSPASRGCRGEGRQSSFPSWNSGSGEPSLAGPAQPSPAFPGRRWRSPACRVVAPASSPRSRRESGGTRAANAIPAFSLMQDYEEFSPPLGRLGALGGRRGG